ncbi:MAG: TonB-dependent receptor plug domain-containing protein [Flavobacteriaceae bacterium]
MVVLLLCCAAVQAQERLDEVIVTDSRIPKSRKNSGKAVVKITAKEIAKNKGISLAQLLNQYAGMYISGAQMHPGQNLSYNIRGGNNRQVLVRIDGVVVSDPSQIESEFDLRLLGLDQIASIEVVKGASSSLYGSGAATAVIDITTKNTATKKTSLNVRREWGTQNSHGQKLGSLSDVQRQYLQLQRSVAKIGLSASINRFTSDGMSSVVGTENDAVTKENIQFNAKSQYEGPWAWMAFYQRDMIDSDYDTTFPTYADAANSFLSKNHRYGFAPSFTKGKSSVQAHVSWSDTERDFASNFPINYTSNVFTSELTWRYRASEKLTLLGGGLVQDIRSKSSNAANGFEHDNVAFFVSAHWQHPKGYALQLSGRNTVHSTFGAHQTFTVNPYYVFSFADESYWKLFSALATSFIAPSQYKMFDPNYGNLSLAPEENKTLESGVEYVSTNSRITIVGFEREETNVIDFVLLPNFSGQYRNNAKTYKVKGVEIAGDFSFKNLTLQANYTFVEKVKQDPIRLPKHAANLGVSYDRPKAQWGAHLRYVGSRSDTNFENGKRVHLAAFTLLDARVSFPNLIGDASASLSLTNVFDATYTEFYGFTTLGRNLNIGLQYAF